MLSSFWKKSLVTALLFMLVPWVSVGQHWQPPEPTGVDHTIIIMSATVDGQSLQSGDEVAVFTSDGLLAGSTVWPTEGAASFAAWGDDPFTETTVEGFQAGEAFEFRAWINGAGQVIEVSADYNFGPESFQPDGFSRVNLSGLLSAPREEEEALPEEMGLRAYPNPFNPRVTLQVPATRGTWKVSIVDMAGRVVRTITANGPAAVWDGLTDDGRTVASGLYLAVGHGSIAGQRVKLLKLQ